MKKIPLLRRLVHPLSPMPLRTLSPVQFASQPKRFVVPLSLMERTVSRMRRIRVKTYTESHTMHRWRKLQANLPWFIPFAVATATFLFLLLNNAIDFLGVVEMDVFVALYLLSLACCWISCIAKQRETMTRKGRYVLAGIGSILVASMLLTYLLIKPQYTVSDALKAVWDSEQIVSVSINQEYTVMDCEPPLGTFVQKGYVFHASTKEERERILFFDPISGRYYWMD